MANTFNPYTSWLRIPKDQLPPDYYRLLGLKRFEKDARKIERSVEKRVVFLQDVSNGPHVNEAQRLLSEVARARICLRNEQRREKYDEKLKAKLGSARLKIELPEINELPNPDQWVFQGAIPDADLVQQKRKIKKSDPFANIAKTDSAQTLGTRRAKGTAEASGPGTRKWMPILITVNTLLLMLAGLGVFWIWSDPNRANVVEVEPVPSVAIETNEKTLDPIEEDFEKATIQRGSDQFESAVGTWNLDGNAVFANSDPGLRHLHLLAGPSRSITLKVDPKIAFPAELQLDAELVQREIPGDDFLIVESSQDGTTWQPFPQELKSKRLLTRQQNQGEITPNQVYYWLEDSQTRYLKITCNSKEHADGERAGGILIGKLRLSPITQQQRDKPTF
ncbi:MAG: hypothetical protein AAF623_16745 [Planctomycetota bacterium]